MARLPKRRAPAWLVLALALVLGGCAGAGTAHSIRLHYPPLGPDPAQAQARPAAAALAPEPLVVIGPVEDARRWPRVGETRALGGLRTARLESVEPAAAWLRRSLVHELTRAGYRVLAPAEVADAERAGGQVRWIEARLTDCFVTDRFFYDARVGVQLWVRCPHGKVLAHPVVLEDVRLALDAEGGAAEALAVGLRGVARRLTAELAHHRGCGEADAP